MKTISILYLVQLLIAHPISQVDDHLLNQNNFHQFMKLLAFEDAYALAKDYNTFNDDPLDHKLNNPLRYHNTFLDEYAAFTRLMDKDFQINQIHLDQLLLNPDVDQTLLFILASKYGSLDIMKTLKNADPSAQNNRALILACEFGHLDIVDFLIENPKVNLTDVDNMSIILAAENGHVNIVNTLLSKTKVDPAARNNMAIRIASDNGYFEIVESLLNTGKVDPSALNSQALILASKNGHGDIVLRLLKDARVDPTVNNNFIIIWAAYHGNLELVEELLKDSRVNPRSEDDMALRIASKLGHESIVQLLLKDPRMNTSVIHSENNQTDPKTEIVIATLLSLFLFAILSKKE